MPKKLAERAKYKRPKFNFGSQPSDSTPPGLPTAPAPKKTSGARPPRTMNMNIDASRKPTAPKAPASASAAARKPVSNFSKGVSAPIIKKQTVGAFSGPSGPVVKKQTSGAFSGGPEKAAPKSSYPDRPSVTPKNTPSKTYKAAPAATPAANAVKASKKDDSRTLGGSNDDGGKARRAAYLRGEMSQSKRNR